MEVELVTNEISEEDTFQIGNDNDDSTFEGERCGICMDLIVDRGVLDCCQHWFCFSCIDNWATITNLCPLCQNEFQLITCVPVYDTIGSNKLEEDSYSRDDEWSIEGKNSSLSFPSYYIDENAVVCLDGDGCKIRSGQTIEEDSDFDTSIACDSCDKWYHAFCVEFDPENTIEGTWLCPRCIACEVQQRPDNTSVQKLSEQCSSANARGESLAEAAFSRKVSVSVADVGETALVVSMVGGSQWTEEPTVGGSQWTQEPTVSYLSKPEVGRNLEKETLASRFGGNSSKVEKLSNKRIDSLPEMDAQELALSLSHDKLLCEIENIFSDKATNKHCIDGFRISSIEPFGQSYDKLELSGSDSRIGLNLGLSVGSFLSDDHIKNNGNEDQVAVGMKQGSPSDEFTSPSDKKIVHSATVGAAGVTGIKRKHTDCSADGFKHAENDGFSEKKVTTKVMIETISSADQASKSHSNDPKKCPNLIAVTQDDKGRHNVKKEDTTSDIMSIVKGTNRRPLKGIACSNFADKSAKEREAGLRVKKIMRRAARDKESSVVVQELRKEIREAVQNKSPIEFGDNLFDPKLLAAFRTAVAGPVTEPASHLVVKAKKSMLQKGKTRDNLTKKIYGMNGKRRRAWDRECEIEFWKHRCMRTSRPEKIGTLKSVLDLLKKNSGSAETGQQSESQATNPILSRLYLADTSVFPRKDDIKPLSALNVACTAKLSEEQRDSMEDASKSPLINQVVQMPEINNFSPKVSVPLFDKEKKNSVPCVKSNASSSKVNLNRSLEGSLSLVGGSKVKTKKEAVVKSEDIRSDKRKWALEVLARKTAVAGSNVTQEKQEDSAVLKGNYPLLAQLPSDMRPLLAPSRHNKIPISVRQAQLYRLTEHFLRNANLPVIRRTGDTELAVADAVNIEKDVADRSNSKLVYVNLCSQELLRHSNNSNTDRGMESNSSHLSATSADGTEPETNNPPSSLAVSSDRSEQVPNNISDPDVEEALRTAGLLSDSPPDSPLEETKDLSDEDDPPKKREEGVDNKNEMDSLVELDIYGDFEYDLEDEDYIGASASASASTVNLTKPQSGESRLKVVFSTLDSERPQNAVNCENCEELGISEVAKDSTNLLKCSTVEDITDKLSCPLEALPDEEGEELSVAECEELYGPDKAPLLERFPGAPEKLFGTVGAEAVVENIVIERGENCVANKQVKASELVNESHSENQILISINHNSTGEKISPNSSQTSENVQRKEKKSNTNPNNQSDSSNFVSKKVEAYIKEHIRPLCKSGVITAEQYRWAVAKTTEKVMKYHLKDKNANFLIKEGEKVKKLAEQYVETAQQKEKK